MISNHSASDADPYRMQQYYSNCNRITNLQKYLCLNFIMMSRVNYKFITMLMINYLAMKGPD